MKKSNKVVFLDIDGVVNTIMIDINPFPYYDKDKQRLVNGFYSDICSPSDLRVSNRQAIMWLNKLCIESGADIVITSTWKLHGLDNVIESLRNSGLIDNIKVIGATPRISGSLRGDEIRIYLSEHPEIDNFVILDDDRDMCEFVDKLVQTDVYVGFTMRDYLKALDILRD